MEKIRVYKTTDMPEDLKKEAYEYFDRGKDTYVEWYVGDGSIDGEDFTMKFDEWLMEGGAKEGEQIFLKY